MTFIRGQNGSKIALSLIVYNYFYSVLLATFNDTSFKGSKDVFVQYHIYSLLSQRMALLCFSVCNLLEAKSRGIQKSRKRKADKEMKEVNGHVEIKMVSYKIF